MMERVRAVRVDRTMRAGRLGVAESLGDGKSVLVRPPMLELVGEAMPILSLSLSLSLSLYQPSPLLVLTEPSQTTPKERKHHNLQEAQEKFPRKTSPNCQTLELTI